MPSLPPPSPIYPQELDAVWQAMLSHALGFSALNAESLARIEELDCVGYPIRSLEPLLLLPNLRRLDLSGTGVSDLRPLALLPRLRELSVCYGQVSNLRPLEQIETLEMLDISYPCRPLRGWEAIGGMKSLRSLFCNHCGLRSVVPFLLLNELKLLSLSFNPIAAEEMDFLCEQLPGCQVIG